MAWKSPLWYPIAIVVSAANLVGMGLAMAPGEAWHAATHATLAVGFGLWARQLRDRRGTTTNTNPRIDGLEAGMQRLEALENEMRQVQQELSEAQERLDFAERLLAQRAEPGRVGPQGPPKPPA